MNKIEVIVLNEATENPAGMQLFLARLTQRGATIHDMKELRGMYTECMCNQRSSEAIRSLAAMPHGTIKRFSPITIAIVGASRRFLAQARTNQVGLDYVSASLQYSDYSGNGEFVVPYEIFEADKKAWEEHGGQGIMPSDNYLHSCENSMNAYQGLARHVGNDAAGYVAPQGLRNILIMQGNHQSWEYFIRLRTCNRNTAETQYVALRIWEELSKTTDGESLFAYAGADCVWGKCREGKMCCGKKLDTLDISTLGQHLSRAIINTKFPLLKEVK
jgi:thymidylate synthase (FAD)